MSTQNKLVPLLAVIAVVVIVFVLYQSFRHVPGPAAAPIKAIPAPTQLAKSDKTADSDSPADTLRTLTAEVKELKASTQQLNEENSRIKYENNNFRTNEPALIERVRTALHDTVPTAAKGSADTASNIVDGAIKDGTGSLTSLSGGVSSNAGNAAGIPGGLGYDNLSGAATATSAQLVTPQSTGPRRYVRLVPMGMIEAKGASGQTGFIKINPPAAEKTSDGVNSWLATGEPPQNGGEIVAPASASRKKSTQPFFTIPENATLAGATAMTAIIGRVPVDGRVQDPMPFKLLIGRENLAANNQAMPSDIAGLIVSGTAIGDMTLNCSEGLIHSLTFVFNDGTIQTVSRRHEGGIQASSGTGTQSGLVSAAKLGYISDEYGNPCIAGHFVTNAPAYLTDVIGLKTLTLAAQSYATAQTTTVANGLGSSSSVTGNKNSFVLGQAVGGATDEVSNWIMRRLNNSFDAVVTRAGAHVVVHMDQEIKLDKSPDARKLDYGHLNGPGSSASLNQMNHGLD